MTRDAGVVGMIGSETGRYATQGSQARVGVELWARRFGRRLVVEDDGSRPDRAAELFGELRQRGCRFVLAPYGSDSVRAVARAADGAVVWNHGAAADDVQRLPGVVSVASPSSGYLVALARVIARERPGATLAVAVAHGRFAQLAADALDAAAPSIGVRVVVRQGLGDPVASLCDVGVDAALVCGPLRAEVRTLRELRARAPALIAGGVSPGLSAFPEAFGVDPEGLLAPVQWHPAASPDPPRLGPSTAVLLSDARRAGAAELDYVAVQAYAAALIADHCTAVAPDEPLAVARELRTSTAFGAFELAPSGVQAAHLLAVIRWRAMRQELVTPAGSDAGPIG